jgi:hypothetical protein
VRDEPERVAVTIYGINLFLASVLVSALWRFALRERLIRPDIADTHVRMITRRLAPGLAGYLLVIVVWLFFAGAGRLRGTKIASFDSPLVKIATAWW